MIDERRCLQVNIPALFEIPEFVEWFNSEERGSLATWHDGGNPGEYSDIFLTVDLEERSDEIRASGSNYDMPKEGWNMICRAIVDGGYKEYDGLVWLTNLPEYD